MVGICSSLRAEKALSYWKSGLPRKQLIMPIQCFTPAWMTEEHQMVFDSAKRFMTEQWQPKDEAWRAQGMMDRQAWEDAGANGFLCASMPE